MARGPDFKQGYQQETMRSVDVYPLLCHLLGLKTCHKSRGDIQNTGNLLLIKPTRPPAVPSSGSQPPSVDDPSKVVASGPRPTSAVDLVILGVAIQYVSELQPWL